MTCCLHLLVEPCRQLTDARCKQEVKGNVKVNVEV